MNIQDASAKLTATFKKVGHTKVVTTPNATTLYHYDTAIVSVTNGAVEINNGGYATATTKKFINRALQAVGFSGYLSQRKFALYLTVNGIEESFKSRAVCLTGI